MKLSRTLALTLIACALALSGCATTAHVAEEASNAPTPMCAEAGSIDSQVDPEADLVGVDCFFKEYKGKKSLHFAVKLKNVSSQPQRYRVNLFLDNGKAVGGLIPRKGKPPVVNPGEEASFTYPIQGMAEQAKEVTLLVKALTL